MKTIIKILILLSINILISLTFIYPDEEGKKDIKRGKLKPMRFVKEPDRNKLKLISLKKDLKTIVEDEKYIGENVVLTFNKTDIKTVIEHFSRILGYKIEADPDLKGKITFSLKNTPWNIALEKFLYLNKLEMIFDENQAIIRRKKNYSREIYFIVLFLFLIMIPLFIYFKNKNNKSVRINKKSEDLKLNPIFLDEYSKKIIYMMEIDKIFKDANLSIQSLSDKLSIQPYVLSKIINKKMWTSFPSLINSYRINEAKILLEYSRSKNSNILDIAFEVGFKTKTAFNRTFKNITGLTPSQFKQEKGHNNKTKIK